MEELKVNEKVSPGSTIVINGTRPPCNPGRSMRPSRGCQKAMQDFANAENVNILILSILVYTFSSRMFDLMLPPVVKHSIAVV